MKFAKLCYVKNHSFIDPEKEGLRDSLLLPLLPLSFALPGLDLALPGLLPAALPGLLPLALLIPSSPPPPPPLTLPPPSSLSLSR